MPYPHLAARLYGTPLLLHRAKLEVIVSVLQRHRDHTGPVAEPALPYSPTWVSQPTSSVLSTGIAILPVQGTLVKRTQGLSAASGLTSYTDLSAMLQSAVANPAVRGILLDVDSPGGETGGLFEFSDAVRAAGAIKPVWAVANDNAFSAAYAIACAANKLVLTRTGGVGSIGVIALHVDQSVADANAGLRYTAITAGSHKNDYSPHEPLSTTAQARLQNEVDRLYEMFVVHVATMRGLSPESVRATQAGLYFGPDAVSVGLADAVGSLDEALAHFTAFLTPLSRTPLLAQAPLLLPEIPMPLTHTQTLLSSTSNPVVVPSIDPVIDPAAHLAQARATTRQEAQAIAELCLLAGVPDKTAEFLAQGHTLEAIRQMLLTMKATAQSPEIRTTLDPNAVLETHATGLIRNPLIAAIKKLTAQE